MISPTTPTVCLEKKFKNFQSRNVTLSMQSSSEKIIAFDMISMLLVIRQPSLNFQLNNDPPPNAAMETESKTESWLP